MNKTPFISAQGFALSGILFLLLGISLGYVIHNPSSREAPKSSGNKENDPPLRVRKETTTKFRFFIEKNDSLLLCAMDASVLKGPSIMNGSEKLDCFVEEIDSFWTLKLEDKGKGFVPATIGEVDEDGKFVSFWSQMATRHTHQKKRAVYYYRLTTKNGAYVKTEDGKIAFSSCDRILRVDHIVYVGGEAGDIIIGVAQQEEFEKELECKCH